MMQSSSRQTSWFRSKHYLSLSVGLLFLSLEIPALAQKRIPLETEADLIEALADPPEAGVEAQAELEPFVEPLDAESFRANPSGTEELTVEQGSAVKSGAVSSGAVNGDETAVDAGSLSPDAERLPVEAELETLADSLLEQLEGEVSERALDETGLGELGVTPETELGVEQDEEIADSPDIPLRLDNGIQNNDIQIPPAATAEAEPTEVETATDAERLADPTAATETETTAEVGQEITTESEVTAEPEEAPASSEATADAEATADDEVIVEVGNGSDAETYDGVDSDGAEGDSTENNPAISNSEDLEDPLAQESDAPPIPSLADRCAAPEATLFPPEPDPEEIAEEEGVQEEETNEEQAAAQTEETGIEAEPEAIPETKLETEPESDSNSASAETSPTAQPAEISAETASETNPQTTDNPDEAPIVEPDTDLEELDEEAAQAKAEAEQAAAEEKERICALFQADQRYEAGELAEAEALYRTAKVPFELEAEAAKDPIRESITDPEDLSPAGRVFLREAAAGEDQNLETRILVPLDLLVKQHPEFIPGQIQLSQALVQAGRSEEGLAVLNKATSQYPNEPSLIRANIALAADQGEWMDAAMLARRFAQLNPEHPEAEDFVALAEENMELYKRDVRDRLRTNTIANVLTGAISVALTGNVWNSLSAVQTTTMMLRGEEGVGNGISKSIRRQVEMVEDEEIVDYIDEMGQRLAKVAGRDEFDYEFGVVMDDNLNAFALPGGKIFVNAGAIAKTESEAELAGLLSHEIAHAVLSHGFRLVSDGNLLADLTRFVPYGGYASNLVVLNYSREMEREADELGARILSSAGYAADGLHGLMKTLADGNNSRRPLFAWMSTHPETEERVGNLEEQITREGLDRYKFEGVERHHHMRVKIKRLINEWKIRKAKEAEERPWWR